MKGHALPLVGRLLVLRGKLIQHSRAAHSWATAVSLLACMCEGGTHRIVLGF